MALTQTKISMLYVAIFNRASEGEGNKFWQDKGSMNEVATAMLDTDAAKGYFGTNIDTNQAFIEHIYLNTLGKTVTDDAAGIKYWVDLLEAGKSRGEVIEGLVNAATDRANAGDAQDQFNNRVAVSDHMAETVEKAPTDYETSTVFATTGTEGLVVTNDTATVTSADAVIDGMIATKGEDFALTTEKDTITGTDGDDTITGVISSLSSDKTLNTDDTIDGGAGKDTLNLDMQGNLSALTGSIKNVENINLTNSTTIARGFNAKNISDVDVYTLDSEKAINLSNLIEAGVEVSAKNMQNNFSVTFDSATDLTGSSDAMSLTFDGVGAAKVLNTDKTVKTAENDVKVTMASIEELTLKSQNNASFIDLSATDASKYIVTGDKGLTISRVKDGLSSIDASAMSGNLNINTSNISTAGSLKDLKGGSGDDTFTVDAADILANATIEGGAGNDTLILSDTVGSTIQPKMSSVENLQITDVTGTLTISSKDITDLTSIVLAQDTTPNQGSVELVTQGSADIMVKTVGDVNKDLTLDTSGSVTFGVTGKDAKSTVTETSAGDITVANSTSLNINVDKYLKYTGSIVATKATSIIIDSKGDITSGDSSDFSSAESLTVTAGGVVDLSSTAIDKVANVTLSGTETTSKVALGTVGNLATDYDLTITSTGLKAGLTTDAIASKQNVTLDLTGTTGNITTGAITSESNSVTINAKNLTGTLETGVITAKSLTIDASDSLKALTIGTGGSRDITVEDSFTYTAGLKAANSNSGLGIHTTGTTATVTLNGGIGDDKFAVLADDNTTTSLTVKGDLGIGANQILIASGDLSASATPVYTANDTAITIDASGLTASGNAENIIIAGSTKADTITGTAGDDLIGGMGGDDTLTGGAGKDIFVFNDESAPTIVVVNGNTTITDFKVGEDKIFLNYTPNETGSLGVGYTINDDADGNAVVTIVDDDGKITLTGVNSTDLSDTDIVDFGA